MRSLCNLQVCHLVASFCTTPSKGFSWHQVQEGEALLSMRPIRKDAGATPSEHPTSVICVIGAGQVPAGCTCSSAWGPGPAVSVSAVGVLQCSHGLQEETNSSVNLARPKPPLQPRCPYMPPKPSHTNDSQFPECVMNTLALPSSLWLARPSPLVLTDVTFCSKSSPPPAPRAPEHTSVLSCCAVTIGLCV